VLIDQQTEAFLEAQLAGGGIADLLTQGVGHSGQFHGVQLFDRRLHKHELPFFEAG
jgi:hypothetical protein